MKILMISLIYSFPLWASGQIVCDTVEVEKIVNAQLKFADKWFDRPFILTNSSVPYNPNKSIYQTDSVYTIYPCDKNLNWNQFKLHSKYGTVESDTTTNKEYSLFISAPIFDEKKTKCRFITNTSYSEWGGQVRMNHYAKRGRKWKLVRSSLISVS